MCVRQVLGCRRRLRCLRPSVWAVAIAVCLVYALLAALRLPGGRAGAFGEDRGPGNASEQHRPDAAAPVGGSAGGDVLGELTQVESILRNALDNHKKTVVLRGYHSISESDLRLYQQIFAQYGYGIVLSPESNRDSGYKEGYKDEGMRTAEEWDMLICFTAKEDNNGCLSKEGFNQLQLHQKVNRIPALEQTLCSKNRFCHIMNVAQRLPVLQPLVISPLCLDYYADLEPANNSVKAGNTLSLEESDLFLKLQNWNDESGTKQYDTYSEDSGKPQTVPIDGLSTIVKVYVLVTSLSPLRAFIHSTGLVQSELNKKFFVTKLLAYFEKYFGMDASAQAFENMKELITQLLLITEANIELSTTSQGMSLRCCSCFQLLAFDLSFGMSIHPVVIEVHQQPVFEADDSIAFADRITKEFILEDTFQLLLSGTTEVSEVYEALENTHRPVGLKIHQCLQQYLCLTSRDLARITSFHKEIKNQGRFELLYPSSNPEYQRLLHFLYRSSDPTAKATSLLEMHLLFSELHKQFQAQNLQRELDYTVWDPSLVIPGSIQKVPSSIFEKVNTNSKPGQYGRSYCSTAKNTLAYITRISTSPRLNLNPAFMPKIKVYYSEVPFDVVIVKIRADAANCHCQVHLDERKGPRIANYPLGLGNNRINILVIDESRSEPVVTTTYTINVYRHSRPSLPVFDGSVICSFVQDCGLIIQPDESCGLQPVLSSYFSAVTQTQLPVCKTGDAKGQWVVPCLSCFDNQTCDWQKARWQPHNCHHLALTRSQLQQCMKGKRALFIGDSTNRGMMYYLMEKVNETLLEWDKAHDMKFYYNLNGGKTFASYVYYPQFWLSLDRRPTFEKALEHLIDRSRPLENNYQTVLVIGGVQWLNTHHLPIIQNILQRNNLLNIHVIIKSIGMGFHLPVDGIRSLTLSEVQRLWKENTKILSEASEYGYDVVDTFSITMGRYKEFLQGRCACHFHEKNKAFKALPCWKGPLKSKQALSTTRFFISL
eukprot:gi/632973461/ref/XP_007903166.1/ PREDICTED: cadherin-like and PC-esterase domain-containing protein 1 isoform X2 [Callorhinchus milii]